MVHPFFPFFFLLSIARLNLALNGAFHIAFACHPLLLNSESPAVFFRVHLREFKCCLYYIPAMRLIFPPADRSCEAQQARMRDFRIR